MGLQCGGEISIHRVVLRVGQDLEPGWWDGSGMRISCNRGTEGVGDHVYSVPEMFDF